MHSLRLFTILSISLLSLGLPTAPDSEVLLANAKQAQELNTQFKDLKSNDECKTGDEACIGGARATCVDDKWETDECPQNLECFVLPSVRREGTITACTSDKIANALISALGADGGAFGSGNAEDNNNEEENKEEENNGQDNEDNEGDNEGEDNKEEDNKEGEDYNEGEDNEREDNEGDDEIIPFPPSNKKGDTVTVDITMTAPPQAGATQATISLVPLTRTLTPEEANKIAGGAAAPAPSPPVNAGSGAGAGAGGQGGQKTIILTNSPAPTPALKGAIDQPNGSRTITLVSNATPAPEAAAAQAPAAEAPAAAPPAAPEASKPLGGGYGGGY